jgi:hypothetical protein
VPLKILFVLWHASRVFFKEVNLHSHNPKPLTMSKLKFLLLSAFAFAGAASAQFTTVVGQWTFDGANPETGINGTTVSTWTTSAPNSVPSAGVLRFATIGDANWGDANLLPDIDTSTIATMTWTVEVTDLYIQAGETIRFSSNTSGSGVPEVEFTSWGNSPGVNDTFSPDIEYTGSSTDDLDVTVASLNGSSLGGPLTMVATWDFVNNTMSFETSGSVVASGSKSTGSDLSDTIGTITGFRVRDGGANSWMILDTVTIETVAVPEPSTFALLAGFATLGLVLYRRRR